MSNENKKVSPLREAMGNLDSVLPDHLFDSNEGELILDRLNKVWDEIDQVEKLNHSRFEKTHYCDTRNEEEEQFYQQL